MISPPTTSTCGPLRWSRRRRGKYQKRSVFSSRRSPSIRGMGKPSLAVRFAVFRRVADGRSEDPAADRLKGIDFARRALEVASDDPGVLVNAAHALAYFGED